LIELHRHVTKILDAKSVVQIPDVEHVTDLWDYAQNKSDALVLQYTGGSEAPFFTVLAKKP
jgi:hypothetical protein